MDADRFSGHKTLSIALTVMAVAAAALGWSRAAQAATRTWDGGHASSNAWNTSTNWSSNTIPVAGDIVIFDGTSDDPCVINVNVPNLASFSINTGYDGTISASAGMFLSTTGNFSQAAGTFTAPSKLIVGGSFSRTGGTFNHNSGIVVLSPSANFTLPASTVFNELRIEDWTEAGLVAYLKMDETSGTTTTDHTGNGHTGTLANGPTWATTGLAPGITFANQGAINFDNVDDCVTLANPGTLPWSNQAQSISVWLNFPVIKPYAEGGDDLVAITATNSNVQVGMWHNEIRVWRAGGGDAGRLCGLRTNAVDDDQATSEYPAVNTWHHFAYTYDGTTHRCYLNGNFMSSSTLAQPTSGSPVAPTGADVGCRATVEEYNGKLDDVRIYNITLTAADVANLAAGRYPNRGGTATVSLGGDTTVNGTLAIDSGTLSILGFNLGTAVTDATKVALINGGILTVGTGTATFNGGLTVQNGGVLTMDSTGGVAIGNAKILTINGTLDSSETTVPVIRAVTPDTNSYTFNVGASATMNVDGLGVQDTDGNGMNFTSATAVTFTQLDNVAFTSGTGAALTMAATALSLFINGITLDGSYTTSLSATDSDNGNDTRIFVGGTCNGSELTCEANDSDNDSTADGVADSGGAVVQWGLRGSTDMPGSVVGYPVASFDWDDYSHRTTYVAVNNGNVHSLYGRDTDGKNTHTAFSFTVAGEDILGTPIWWYDSGKYYVYLITTKATIYKLEDTGSSFASQWVMAAGDTATSNLTMDGNGLYFAGTDSGTPLIIKVSHGGGLLSSAPVSAVNAAPVLYGGYLYSATSGALYRTRIDFSETLNSNTPPNGAVYTRVRVFGGTAYLVQENGIARAFDLGATGLPERWSYQDNSNHSGCVAGEGCTVKSLAYNWAQSRLLYGDRDGHVYNLYYTGTGTSGSLVSGYPFQPGGSGQIFETPPLYNDGLIVIGSTTGRVYFIDQQNAANVPAVTRMLNLNAAISSIAYDYNSPTSGEYMIGTANGKVYHISKIADPTPSNN